MSKSIPWLDAIREGVRQRSQSDRRRIAALIKDGTTSAEAMRQVLFPWKSPEAFDALMKDYEKFYGTGA